MKRIALALMLCAATGALAQQYPVKPVRMIVPVSAGGLKDVLVRAVSAELSKMWGQPVVVENRLGAAHIVATEHVAKSAPDGYTILATDKPWTANPFLYARLPYDGLKSMVGVVNMAQVTEILLASPHLPATNLKELLAHARANPGKLNYGSFGKGSVTHIDAESLATAANVKFTHIPYKGIADVLPALMSGEIHIAFSAVPPALPLVKQGRIRAIAYGASQRSPVLPDVPTFKEAGLPFESWSWNGLMAPAGTPRPVIEKIAADVGRVLQMPDIRAKYYDSVGMEMLYMGPAQFEEFLKADRASFAEIVKVIGLKPE
jgi:tripartite-type tricarboxylate transporter receptor subunit TctC